MPDSLFVLVSLEVRMSTLESSRPVSGLGCGPAEALDQ